MVTVTTEVDLLYTINGVSGVTGQSPFKPKSTIDSTDNWTLVDKLGQTKIFQFTVPNDEFHRANVMLERDVTVPFITPFQGVITTRERGDKDIKFTAEDKSWHFTRRDFMHDGVSEILYTDQNWYDKDWKTRIPIEIKTTKLLDGLNDYTILLHITDIDMARSSRLDGFDFVITDKDGTTKLSHEIERYTSSTGDLYVWVKLIKLEAESSRDIYLYYDNPEAADQQDVEGTWNSDFAMVQHLNGDSIDSTSNNNDGTDTSITYVTTAGIAESAQFDGTNSKIDCASGTSIDDIFGSGGTIEFIIKAISDGEGNQGIILRKLDGSTGWYVNVISESGGFVKLRFNQSFDAGVTQAQWETNLSIQLNKDMYCAITYDNSAAGNNPIFNVNGQTFTVGDGLTETTAPGTTADSDAASNLIIGNATGQTLTFDGEIDEVQLSSIIKTQDEINFNYQLKSEKPNIIIIKSKENFVKPIDEIAQDIIDNANDDMPLLDKTTIPNIISLWKFDNDALDTLGSNDLIWSGNEKYRRGVYHDDNQAVLDGSSYLTHTTLLDTTPSNFTFSFWFTPKTIFNSNASTDQYLLSKINIASSDTLDVKLDSTTGSLQFITEEGNNGPITLSSSNTVWDAAKKYFVGIEWGSSGMKLYIHGSLDVENLSATTLMGNGTANDFAVGRLSSGGSNFIGRVDDLRYYERVLTSKEHDILFKATDSHTTDIHRHVNWKLGDGIVEELPGLISLWKFDDSLVDTKASNDFEVTGTEQYDEGEYNNMFDFDGSTYLVSTDTPFDFENNTPFTWTFYVKTTSSTKSALITKQDTPTSIGWGIYMESDGKISFNMINTNTTNHLEVKADTAINTGDLKLITVRKNTGLTTTNVSIKIDNVEESLSTVYDNLAATVLNDIKLYCGATADTSNKFTGGLDDLRCYDNYVPNTKLKRLLDATTSGVDFIRNDDIVQNILPLEFNSENGLESLQSIARSVGTDLYFDSTEFRVYLRQKGKTIKENLDVSLQTKPRQSLKKVTNILNVIGDEDENGIKLKQQFNTLETTKYNYEKTVINSRIKTTAQMNTIGNNLITQFKEPVDDIPATIPYDQFVRFDLQSGDIITLADPDKEINSTYRVTSITATPKQVKVLMRDTKNAVVFGSSNEDIPSVLQNLISRLDQIDKTS